MKLKKLISPNLKRALNQLLVLSINFIGFIGVFLIIYSIIVALSGITWPVLENIATTFTIYATLIGTLIVAASIYFPLNTRPPDSLSKIFSAPIVILAVIITFFSIWVLHYKPTVYLINGFAILAISRSLFRLISR